MTHLDHDRFGQDLAARLHAAERSLDLAIAETNELAAFMTRGRLENQIPAVIGQDVLQAMGSLAAGLTTERRHLIEAHGLLKRDARRLGIGWRLGGPAESPDEDVPLRPSALRDVKAA